MEHYKVNRNDIFFILKEQLDYSCLCKLSRYADLSEKVLDLLVSEALNFAQNVVAPLQETGEKWGVKFENGKVCCPPEFKKVFRDYGKHGFIAAARDTTYGGQGFPLMMRIVINDIMYGACQSFNMAPSLTHGAAHLIETFAGTRLKELFVPRCYSGTWAGTMCLTEAGSGSDLSAIQTTAFPVQDGIYKIKGTKIFISWGEHDLAENIIHLLLARVQGAPEGTRGLSLFIVPKIRVNPDGSLGQPNDVVCHKVESKLGLHASPTCELEFGGHDGCLAYLCGKENQGLAHMFQMMNAARINTGVSGMALAQTAYQNALAYAKARVQGRDVAGRKTGAVPIVEHPDVRRMLLWMKASVDGMRSMIYAGAFWQDLARDLASQEEKTHYKNLVEFMTPIIKAYCSQTGFRVCETAIQCLGGHGFCKDYPIEQYLRDSKIMSLYEGTNGIQAMDLIGRKMNLDNGAPLAAFQKEVDGFCQTWHKHFSLGSHVSALKNTATRLWAMAGHMRSQMKSDPLLWASHAFPALECFAETAMVWRLLDIAIIAAAKMEKSGESPFYKGKVLQATWFTSTTLPIVEARMALCLGLGREITDMPEAGF